MTNVSRLAVLVALLLFSQGCSTAQYDVVLPLIEHDKSWSIDAADWLHYHESLFGPRLSILISPEAKSGHTPEPLRIELLVANGFETEFQIDSQQTYLEIEGKSYTATAVPCHSLGHSQAVSVETRLVVIRKLSRSELLPCMALSFNVSQPTSWEAVTMRISGLTKDNVKITVPEIRFRKTRKSAGGSFI